MGAELSEDGSRPLSQASMFWCSFLCRSAQLAVLPCQVNLLSGGKVPSFCWRKEGFCDSVSIFQGQEWAEISLLVPMGLVRLPHLQESFLNSTFFQQDPVFRALILQSIQEVLAARSAWPETSWIC